MTASLQRDANWRTVDNNEAFVTKLTWTFSAATTGAVGAHTLFDVTGDVTVNVFGICKTNLAGSGTVEVGTASSTAALANQQTCTDIDTHEVWHDAVLAVGGSVAGHTHPVDEDIVLTVGTNTVTGGEIEFYCQWRPLSTGATLTAATPA